MASLWEPKKHYRVFAPRRHDIPRTCGRTREEFIPYDRQYGKLSQDELLSLIDDARTHRWQALDLSSCGLQKLPDELWDLPYLRILHLGNFFINPELNTSPNRLTVLPRKIEKLQNLQVLSLRDQPIQVEGPDPLNLPKLVHLELFGTGHDAYPTSFCIPSLEQMGIDNLSQPLPAQFSSMRLLTALYLNRCSIQSSLHRLAPMKRLRTLSLPYCDIATLPAFVADWTNLISLCVEDTPLFEKLPPEARKLKAQELIRYILKMQGDTLQEFFNESKLVIVGQGQVGKSSLLERLVYETYMDKLSTEGIRIEPWHFFRNSEEYRLNLWDFGGQEIYHATHQFFLTRQSLYLLVWDALQEDEHGRIDYWLRTIQSLAGDSPIFIVINKCDNNIGRLKPIDWDSYQKRFPQIERIFRVSCRDNLGIDTLREAIQERAVSLPLMKTKWFSEWLNARTALEKLATTKNHISYDEYCRICREQGVADEDAPILAKYLHNLGVLLYYHEDTLLRDMVILSSEWGTDAVYKILDQQQRQLKDRNGILYANSDLEVIWDDHTRYPTKYHQHLLNLMENFQLTFSIDKNTYLVTELLESTAITRDDLPFNFGQTLNFRYDYDFMPAGIMTRFIVAANEYLDTVDGVKQCWHKGAYLRYDTAYARVELNDSMPNRHVMIQVSGSNPRHCQELLTYIRQTLDKINSRFQKLVITQKVPCICSEGCEGTFEYSYLLKAEQKGRDEVECQKTAERVNLRKLLDRVEPTMTSNPNSPYIDFRPVINVKAEAKAESKSSATAIVSQEARDTIDDIFGALDALCSEIDDPELKEQCENLKKSLEELDECETNKDIKRSGALSKLKNFLIECGDPESDTNKLIDGTKNAAKKLLSLGKTYNKFAGLIGAPSIPLIGT